jgi:hypothetical protein
MTSSGEAPRANGIEMPDDPRPDQALFALDLVDVLQEPAVASLLAIDRGEGTLGQLNQHSQQAVIGYKAVKGLIGNTETIKNVEVMEALDMGVVSHSLRATSSTYAMLVGAANALGVDQNRFIRSFPRYCVENAQPLMNAIVGDFYTFCRRGLLGPDGSSENYQEAAKRLRLLNLVLLFSPQASEPDLIAQTYTQTLYEGIHPVPIANETRVGRFTAELGSEITDLGYLSQLSSRLSPTQRLNVYNRACEYLLLSNAASQFSILDDVQGTRRLYQRAFRDIADRGVVNINQRVVNMSRRLDDSVNQEENSVDIVDAAQLDWEVLPEADLEERAREIVKEASDGTVGKQPEIALERLVILSNLRERWGRQNSYYAYGKLGTRNLVISGEQEQPDHYVLLVLQERGHDGEVIAEHVVAESPIEGPNALYVFRQDVSEGQNWQNVMALPKKYARALKARAIKHTMPKGQTDLISVMTEKVGVLLDCSAQDFNNIEFSGSVDGHTRTRIRVPRAALPQDPVDGHSE